MRKGIYCGSFDPVHYGHVEVMRTVLSSGYVDGLMVVATEDYWDKHLSALSLRLKMLEAVVPVGAKVDSSYSSFIYTNELFEQFKKREEGEPVLVLGADNLVYFEKWRDYEELLKYDFFVVCRPPFDKDFVEKRMADFKKENYLIAALPPLPVSSSEVRQLIKEGKDVSLLVGEDVKEIIEENGLYLL